MFFSLTNLIIVFAMFSISVYGLFAKLKCICSISSLYISYFVLYKFFSKNFNSSFLNLKHSFNSIEFSITQVACSFWGGQRRPPPTIHLVICGQAMPALTVVCTFN